MVKIIPHSNVITHFEQIPFVFSQGLPLIGTILRLLQHSTEGKHDGSSKEDTKDEQLQALAEITAEFLADICIQIPKVFPKGTL